MHVCRSDGAIQDRAGAGAGIQRPYPFLSVRAGGLTTGPRSRARVVVGVAVGIAIDEGLLTLDEKLCESFPEYVRADTSRNLLAVTVRNMLTMKTALKELLFFSDDPERYRVKDWIQYFFDAEFTRKPGEAFLYNNFNTYMLVCLIEKKAGVNLLEYLRDRLFEPIGIGNPDWLSCPKGHMMGANGLYLTVEEMGMFGQLVMCGGEWIGKRIISKRYIAAATTKQVETGVAPNIGTNSSNSGYGYHFGISHVPNTFLCKGRFGQCCVIAPDKDSVFTFQALEGYKYNFMFDMAAELPLLL